MTTNATQRAGDQTAHDLFVLSDEQILDIKNETEVARTESRVASQETSAEPSSRSTTRASEPNQTATAAAPASTAHASRATSHDPIEPPAWLAAQMQDPWGGEEAREFWDGVQQARQEAAAYQAYRAAIASPEDARALKELYPRGVSEARAAAERARLLDEVDRAYFGAAGNSPEQLSASRAQLAQRMLHEDPAAFREMVEAGIRVLQNATDAQAPSKSLASAVSGTSSGAEAATTTPQLGNAPAHEAQVAAYAAFERAANEDLERSVGTAIERTLAQALPSFEHHATPGQAGAQRSFGTTQDRATPLRERLAASVRTEVEKALQGDRQVGEQVAQILASRRFDDEARAQIVRLIGERAQQLVPGAAKRVLNEWTQTTLAAHRGRTQPVEVAPARAEVAPVSAPGRPPGNQKTQARRQDVSATKSQAINYRKFSDEQILEM
jgi:hypothetical protein